MLTWPKRFSMIILLLKPCLLPLIPTPHPRLLQPSSCILYSTSFPWTLLFHSHFFVQLAPSNIFRPLSTSWILFFKALLSCPSLRKIFPHFLSSVSRCDYSLFATSLPGICLLLHISYTHLVDAHWFDLNSQCSIFPSGWLGLLKKK